MTKFENQKAENPNEVGQFGNPSKLVIDDYLSANEVMQRLEISYNTFKSWFLGKPNVIKVGRRFYVHIETFNQVFLKN